MLNIISICLNLTLALGPNIYPKEGYMYTLLINLFFKIFLFLFIFIAGG